eukprot:8851593-Pyramimonas_sp.AAC.1
MTLASPPRPHWHSRRGLLEHIGRLWGGFWGLSGVSRGPPGGLLKASWGHIGAFSGPGGDRSGKRGASIRPPPLPGGQRRANALMEQLILASSPRPRWTLRHLAEPPVQ